jgi:DNA-binding NtrC family response regulator
LRFKIKGNLLIVEDEKDLLDILISISTNFADEVVGVENGIEALEIMKGKEFHLIISDLKMDKMDGPTLSESLRGQNNHIPFIILSGLGTEENTIEALRLGAMDFIKKPFFHDDLLPLIQASLKIGHEIQEVTDSAIFPEELKERAALIKR